MLESAEWSEVVNPGLAWWPAARRGGEAYRKLLQELLALQAAHEASGDARAEDAA